MAAQIAVPPPGLSAGASSILYGGILVVALDAMQLVVAVVLLLGISAKLTVACAALFPLYALTFRVFSPRVVDQELCR